MYVALKNRPFLESYNFINVRLSLMVKMVVHLSCKVYD